MFLKINIQKKIEKKKREGNEKSSQLASYTCPKPAVLAIPYTKLYLKTS
jgi:hypothetical protein